ncbi:hypothetical protein [Altererythrobacter sp. Z27]|uniref:hypothetical protein n=1 Tax=Altererythrobacter sp. Z27 TaxID=3461147 RepID=UPI00404451D9
MFAKHQAIFRSRWRALLWAAGVLLTAYCSVPSPDEAQQARPAAKPQHVHHNPWAIDPAKR